jgi:hypothetical protein
LTPERLAAGREFCLFWRFSALVAERGVAIVTRVAEPA